MAETTLSVDVVPVETPDDINIIIGQAHFIKTVDYLHEALVGVSPHLGFGVAFCESSGARLVHHCGNDDDLTCTRPTSPRRLGLDARLSCCYATGSRSMCSTRRRV